MAAACVKPNRLALEFGVHRDTEILPRGDGRYFAIPSLDKADRRIVAVLNDLRPAFYWIGCVLPPDFWIRAHCRRDGKQTNEDEIE